MAGLDILEDEDDGFADDTYDREPVGALPSSQATTAPWRAKLSRELDSNAKAISKFYAPRVKAYDDMAAAIRARRTGPSRAEQLFAVSAALAAPTKYSGLGAAFSNLSPALAAMEGQKRVEGLENEDLANKYRFGALDKEEEGFKAAQDNRAELLKIEARYANQRQPAGPQIVQVAERLYPNDPAKQQDYILRNSPSSLAAARKSSGGGGSGGGESNDGVGVGKTVAERMQSILLNGDPNSPRYAAAYQFLSKPRETINGDTGQIVRIKQDMSWARPPMVNGKPVSWAGTPSVSVGDQVIVPKMTQEQKIAAGFADRMGQAELDLSATEEALGDPGQVAKDAIPLVGNYLVSKEYQGADQAKRNWINANLRRESGATIQQPEFDNANRQYFIQPGDSPEVRAQKKRNRQTAEEAMRRGTSNVIKSKPAPAEAGDGRPANIDAVTWSHMTPEDKALWKKK